MKEFERESFEDFKKRIDSFAWKGLYSREAFSVNAKASSKVNDDGTFKRYFGNTVVFELPEEVKEYALNVQDKLYSTSPTMFAERLPKDSFHVTLHDLLNGAPCEELSMDVALMTLVAREIIRQIHENRSELRFTTTALLNMVSVSMVLVVMPADEETYNTLMDLYMQFEELVHLEYKLTPHITLAYFKPGTYGKEALNPLADLIEAMNSGKKCEFSIDTDMLIYQIFTDMRRFQTMYK